jgi:peptide chain release factor
LNTIWLSISSGVGPEECAHAAALTLQVLQTELEGTNDKIKLRIIGVESSYEKGNIRSALIALEGNDTEVKEFVKSWIGNIQLVWHSTYRPHHKRKNWFIQVIPYIEPEKNEEFSLSDVRFETARYSGPGGQYVNKTETAVRAIHIPTGKSVVSREERSQLLNKRLALAKLASLLSNEQTDKEKQSHSQLRHTHWELKRGNPIRVYDGKALKLLKISYKTLEEKKQ